MMRSIVLMVSLMLLSSISHAADGKLTRPAEEIQRLCFKEAGIPESDPNHKVTQEEMDAVLRCVNRYIDKL